MRLLRRGKVKVLCRNQELSAAVRPLSGGLMARQYGEYVQDMLRLLLSKDTLMEPGDAVTVQGDPYICIQCRSLCGHIQADLRRCAR